MDRANRTKQPEATRQNYIAEKPPAFPFHTHVYLCFSFYIRLNTGKRNRATGPN